MQARLLAKHQRLVDRKYIKVNDLWPQNTPNHIPRNYRHQIMAAKETLPIYCGDLSTIHAEICLHCHSGLIRCQLATPALNPSLYLIIYSVFQKVLTTQDCHQRKVCLRYNKDHTKPHADVSIGVDYCCHLEVVHLTHYGSVNSLHFKMSADYCIIVFV